MRLVQLRDVYKLKSAVARIQTEIAQKNIVRLAVQAANRFFVSRCTANLVALLLKYENVGVQNDWLVVHEQDAHV